MWMLYKKPFREGLVSNLGFTAAEAKTIAKAAGPDYKAIISKLPEFEKGDRFVTNIVNCSLLVPAMCHLDYVMSDMGGASTFVREYTLASGGPYCDCGYKKKVI